MRVNDNFWRALGYTPTRSSGERQEQPDLRESPLGLDGAADHWSHREDDDDCYSQPGALFRIMSPDQQKALFENTAPAMGDALEGDRASPHRKLCESGSE